jgi:hypothetical protein
MFPTVVESLAVKLTIMWPMKFFGDWPVRPGFQRKGPNYGKLKFISLFLWKELKRFLKILYLNILIAPTVILATKFLKKMFKFARGFRYKIIV